MQGLIQVKRNKKKPHFSVRLENVNRALHHDSFVKEVIVDLINGHVVTNKATVIGSYPVKILKSLFKYRMTRIKRVVPNHTFEHCIDKLVLTESPNSQSLDDDCNRHSHSRFECLEATIELLDGLRDINGLHSVKSG